MFRPSAMPMSPASAPPAEPKHAHAWAALVSLAGLLALGYPALGGGFLVTPPSDQYIGGFPVREFAAQSLKAGLGFPLWNPYIFGGMPYVAAMGVGDVFYPTFILRALLPTDIAMTLGFMIHVFLAGFFAYLFFRALGLSWYASVFGGLAYMMCGPIASYVSPGHDGKLFIGALMPLWLLLLLRGIRFGDRWTWGLNAIVVGLAVLSPHPQLLQYMLLTGGAFSLYFAFSAWDGEPLDRKVALRRLGYATGAVALGFLMGAIQYSSVPGYVPFSPRAGGTSYEFATSFSFPIEELFNTYLPQFSGILDRYWGRNGIHHHSEYLGAALLILATAAIGATGKAPVFRRSFLWFVAGVLVVSLLWALGANTPFYRIVWAIVPGTKFFRAPSTMIFVTAFAVTLFGAIGVERVLSGWSSRTFAFIWAGAAALVMLAGVSGGLTNLAMTVAHTSRADQVAQNVGAVMFGAARSSFFALLTLLMLWGAGSGRVTARAAGFSLIAILGADLWSVERLYWRFSPRASELYRSDATIDYLKAQGDNARVAAIPVPGAALAYHDAMLLGDGLMVHGIRQLTGYHGNEIARYDRLMGGNAILTNPGLQSLLNLQYVLTNVPPTDSLFRSVLGTSALVAGPARNAPGTMVYLYKLPGDNPQARVATLAVKAPDDAALATIQNPGFNADVQRRVAIVDTASTTRAAASLASLPPPSAITAQVTRPSHGRIHVALSAPAQDGNMLIVSENFYPGWRARIDGREATAERANYGLIGVSLTAGARRVELEFTSPAYQAGKATTLAALLAALALFAAPLLRRRRPTVAEAA